jgi:hypothetical protein
MSEYIDSEVVWNFYSELRRNDCLSKKLKEYPGTTWETARSDNDLDPWDEDTEELSDEELNDILESLVNAIDEEEIDWSSSDCDGKDIKRTCSGESEWNPEECKKEECCKNKCDCGVSKVGGIHSDWCSTNE